MLVVLDLQPLDKSTTSELTEDFANSEKISGFVPISLLTKQRKPEIAKALGVLIKTPMASQGDVDLAFMWSAAHFGS